MQMLTASGMKRFCDLRGRNIANGVYRHIIIQIATARVMPEWLACIICAAREQSANLIGAHKRFQPRDSQLCILIELMCLCTAHELIITARLQAHILLICLWLQVLLFERLLLCTQLQQTGETYILKRLQFVGYLWITGIGEEHMKTANAQRHVGKNAAKNMTIQ